MTVSELIAELQKMPGDKVVCPFVDSDKVGLYCIPESRANRTHSFVLGNEVIVTDRREDGSKTNR